MSRRLARPADGRPAAPVRIAHLGSGAFSKAHQAWWTDRAPDADAWGVAAFSGRGPADADLAAQDGLFTLVTRSADGDAHDVVASLSQVLGGTDVGAWVEVLGRPELAVVTSTVTEAGYRRGADGGLDLDDAAVRSDVAALRADGLRAQVTTAPGRLVLGLAVRAERSLDPVAVVPCDNLPGNGAAVARVVGDLAAAAGLDGVLDRASFVSTAVDRITPRATPQDRADVLAATGVDDPAVVVTEPYAEWVLAGDFPAGRPAWDAVGARVVADAEPWERRKLFLLNGSHSLMAYAGSLRGATTVSEAIADHVVRGWVEAWWDDAAPAVGLPADEVEAYRAALLGRYENPRIRHLLAQIAADGSQKVPIRAVPVVRAGLERGQVPLGATRLVAAWTLHLRGLGAPRTDPGADRLADEVAELPLADAVDRVLADLGIDDDRVGRAVTEQASGLGDRAVAARG